MNSGRVVSTSRVIDAPAAAIFDLLADPRAHSRFDGSQTVQAVVRAPQRLALGATFSVNMKIGLRYRVTNRVVIFDEGRRIGWCHFAHFVWSYELEPTPHGTRVTENFDYGVPWGRLIEPLGWPERNRAAMAASLERLSALVTSPQ